MNLRTTSLASLSGLLLAASFPPSPAPFLVWIALVPLFFALKGQSVGNGFRLGGLAGMFFFTGTIYWFTIPLHEYGGVPLFPASLMTLFLSALLALCPALFCAAMVQVRSDRPGLALLATPAIWTTLEFARTYVLTGFPWSLLGYSQYRVLPVIQIADITGVYGVSFVIVLVNAAVAEVIRDRRRYAGFAVALAVITLVLGYGLMQLRPQEGSTGIKVSVVQGNIALEKKWDPAFQAQTLSGLKRLTKEALQDHPDLILWPETATPFSWNGSSAADEALTRDLASFVKQNNVPLLFGSLTHERKPNNAIIARNSALLLQGDGLVTGIYHKIHLVPFGEYAPLKSDLFFTDKMLQVFGDFRPGEEFAVMTLPGPTVGTRIGTAICYEIIFPDLVRRFVNKGANVITTITNDAWFGRTSAPYQHFSIAVLRAIENRVPVVRAANTGISGFIDADGRILATSPLFRETYLTRTITPGRKKSFYTRYGDVFAWTCVIFSVILLAGLPNSDKS